MVDYNSVLTNKKKQSNDYPNIIILKRKLMTFLQSVDVWLINQDVVVNDTK